MDVKSTTKYAKMSVSKGRDLARKLRGMPASQALALVQFSERKAAKLLSKTLKSAIANADNQSKVSVDELRVKEAIFDEGPRMRRHWPRSRGSASPILKRMCHVRVVLTDGK